MKTRRTFVHTLFLTNLGPSHLLTEPRHSPQKQLVIITAPVLPFAQTSKAPSVDLTRERGELGVIKVLWEGVSLEDLGFENAKASAVSIPGNDVFEFLLG